MVHDYTLDCLENMKIYKVGPNFQDPERPLTFYSSCLCVCVQHWCIGFAKTSKYENCYSVPPYFVVRIGGIIMRVEIEVPCIWASVSMISGSNTAVPPTLA